MEFSNQVWAKCAVLLSGNAGEIWLTSIPSSDPVTVTLKVTDPAIGGGEDEISFSMVPDSIGKIRLDVKKILKGLEPIVRAGLDNISGLAGDGLLFLRTFAVSAEQGSDTASISWPVVAGGSPSEEEADSLLVPEYFWNRKPQKYITYISGVETLSLFLQTGKLCARIYFRMRSPETVNIGAQWDLSVVGGLQCIMMCDCSYSRIRAAADEAGYADEAILAYDIFWVTAEGTEGAYVQRFIVRDMPVRTFLFRNSIGTYDTIHVGTDRKRSLESEVTVFENGGEERELRNDHNLTFEENTGYLISEEEVNFWYEFLTSDERYVLSDGVRKRIIIEESDSEVMERSVASITFKWHFAEEPAGAVQSRKVLDEVYIPNEI